jgi:hypothetical protein
MPFRVFSRNAAAHSLQLIHRILREKSQRLQASHVSGDWVARRRRENGALHGFAV